MNEQDLKKMFDFFVSEGYDMGDWKTFPKDMGDDKKRKTMYDFFRAEGYDLGDFDTFKYTDQTTQQSEQRTAAQKAAVTGAKKDPISAALQEASTRMQEYDEGLAKTLEANAKNIQAISQKPKTTKEQRALFEGIPGLEHLTKEPKWGDTPVVDAFIQKNFANATPELKDNLTANLMSMGEQQFKELMSSDLNERRKARLLAESTQKKAQQIAIDLNINKGRAKNLDKYTTLLQAKNYLEQQEPSEEINQSKAQVEAELANFEGSPEQETLKLQGQYEQQRQQLENVYKLHPQEALRLQKVEERKKAVTIQPGDSVGTQIKKQFKATLNEIPNSVIRGAVNLMEVAKQLSDATQEIAGVDTDYQAPSDKAIEALSDFAEDFSQSAFPTLDKAVFEGGDINGEAVLPAISRTISDMAVLLFGAKGLGGGEVGLVLSSLAQTAPDYYYDAKEKGLNNQQALAYAQAQALGQGLLELVNPGSAGQLIAGASSKSLTKLIEKAGQRKLTLADISHHVFNEIAGENAQEMLQMASEKLGQYVSDRALETDFKPEFSKDEVYETLFLTSIVSGLSAGAGLKAASKVRRQEAITKLAELDNVPQVLNNMVQAGTLDIAEAQTVLEDVQAKKEELTPEKLVEAAPEVVDAIAEEDISTLEEATAALNDALQPKAEPKVELKGEAKTTEVGAKAEAKDNVPNEAKSETPKATKLVNPKKVEVGDIVEYEGITYEVSRKKPNGSFDLIEPGNPQAGARGVFPNELYVKAKTEPAPEGEQTAATQAEAESEVQNLPKRDVIATKLKEAFNLTQEEADATMSIYDAVANSWAKKTGKSSEDWYDRLDVKKGTEEDLKRLKKKGQFQTEEPTEGQAPYLEPFYASDKELNRAIRTTDLKNSRTEAELKRGLQDQIDQDQFTIDNPEATTPEEVEKAKTRIEQYKGFLEGIENGSITLEEPSIEFQGEQAAVEKTKEGTIIYALTDPNVSSPVHELAHIFERELTDRQRKIVKEWAGDKKWTRDTSEKFARGFEKYLAEGKAPSIKLKNVFEQFKNWLKDIYKGLITYKGKEIVLNDKMRALYDEILTGEDYVENMKALEDQGVLFQTDEPLFSKFFDQVKKYTEAYKKKYPAKDFEQFKKDFPLKKVKEETLRDAWEGREPQSKTKAKEAELGEQGTRQREGKFAKRASEDSRLLDEVKNEIKENSLNYFTQPNRVTEAAAEYALDQFESDEKAADALMSKDFNHLDGAVKVMLGQKLILRLNESAKNSDNPKKLLEKAADVADFTVDFGREAGRAVQAFRAWSMMSPEGIILWANKQSSKTRTGLLQSHAQDIDLAVEGFRRAENAAKELALKIRPPEPVKLFGYTKEDLKKKKQEAWAKFKKFTGLSASLTGLTKEQIEAIGEYGFYSFVDGLRTIKGWAKNIQKKFGVDDTVTNHIWSNLQTPLGKTLQDLSNVTISDLSIGKKELAEEIKNTFNVTEKEAQAFADQLNKVYNDELQRQARKQARSAISRKGAYGKVGNAIARAVENNNLTRKGIEEALLKEYNHQNLTKEDIDYLEEKAKEMQALPEGFLKDKRVMELMNYLQDKNGESKAWDVATSLWYASILSGPATQMVNITANAVNVGLETFITTLEKLIQGDPASAALAWYGLFTGMKQGWSEAATILAEGAPPNKRSSKFFEANSLERFKLDKNKSLKENIKALVPAIAKYVPRAMSAADTFFYYMAFESAANAYAISLANRKIGLSTKEKNQLVLDMIKGTISLDDAKIQARKELAEAAQKLGKPVESLATNREIKKRAYEIVTESRAAKDFHFIELADKYAAFGTFNYKPQGLLGLFANKISETTSKVPALKLIVPFTNIVANVLNQQLDYTPVGVYRWAANAYNFSNTKLEPFATGDRQLDDRRLIKGLFGTTGLVALFALCLKGIDDEDEAEFPYFTISGAGPRGKQDSYAKKNQLYERGWKPYSIKIGDKWISYQYFPVAAVLTIYGNVHDSYKYDKAEPEKLIPSIVTAMEQIAPAILNMSFLSGLAELFEGLTDEKASESYFKRFGSKTVTSVFPSLLKTIDSAFDPTVYEARTFKERVIKGTPFVKIGLKPQLNTFGEPIKKKPVPLLGSPAAGTLIGAERFTSVMKTDDPVVALFADKGEFAPVIGRSITYDKVKLTDDQYYDYCEMVGKIFKKRIAEQLDYYKGLDGNETLTWAGKPYTQFGKEIKQLHNEIRDQVKSDMFAYGMSKQEILKQNGL